MIIEKVSRLNEEGIFVGYIYDALFFLSIVCKSKKERHEVAADLVVFTVVKKE
jgi:hypothetical protein